MVLAVEVGFVQFIVRYLTENREWTRSTTSKMTLRRRVEWLCSVCEFMGDALNRNSACDEH